MAIITNFPTGSLLITASKIEAALGYTPVDPAKLATLAVTGIKRVGDTDFQKGLVEITKSSVGLDKVENKSAADILGELTTAMVEALLNEDYTGDEDGVNDRLVALETLLGISDDESGSDGEQKSVVERVEDIEEALEDKLELTDITRVLLETTLGNTGYTGADGGAKGIFERIADLVTATTNLETNKMDKSAFTRKAVEEILGNTDYSETTPGTPDEGTSIMDKIGANADAIDDIKEALGMEEGDSEGESVLDRLEALETDLEDYKEEVEDTYVKVEDLTQAKILEVLGCTPESGDDKIGSYTLVATKWVEEKETTGDKAPTGFYTYTVQLSEMTEWDIDTIDADDDIEIIIDSENAPYAACLAAAEAGIVGGTQGTTSFTIKAINKPSVDIPVVFIYNAHTSYVED